MTRKPKKPAVETTSQSSNPKPSGPPAGSPSEVAYVLPDGRAIAVDDTEEILAFLAGARMNPDVLKRVLWGLARACDESGRRDGAAAYLEKILTLDQDPDVRADCFLKIGQMCEGRGDFAAAVAAYSRAFALPARASSDWYFLNNNLGYSLNQLGRHDEAEAYCRAAIAIDAGRHNAHKNLGLSLQGQGRYLEAARCLLEAAQAAPHDLRALGHLEDLLAKHEEIGKEHPEILAAAQACREAALKARRERVM
jgi:tetratricopeptide (TPR) repeat protein